jgi:hypothetical protein
MTRTRSRRVRIFFSSEYNVPPLQNPTSAERRNGAKDADMSSWIAELGSHPGTSEGSAKPQRPIATPASPTFGRCPSSIPCRLHHKLHTCLGSSREPSYLGLPIHIRAFEKHQAACLSLVAMLPSLGSQAGQHVRYAFPPVRHSAAGTISNQTVGDYPRVGELVGWEALQTSLFSTLELPTDRMTASAHDKARYACLS